MSDPKLPSATFTEKLVAYLDGELPEVAAREVEQSLSSDPAVRAEIDQLNRAWEMLDLLPRPNASGEFSSRTLTTIKAADKTNADAMANVAATELFPTVDRTPNTTRRLLVWGMGLLLVAAFSFFVARQRAQTNSDPLVDQLPLIENLETLREIGDVNFLNEFRPKGFPNDRPPPRP